MHLPHTPIVLIADGGYRFPPCWRFWALALAYLVVYGKRPQTADERDPLQAHPHLVVLSFCHLKHFT